MEANTTSLKKKRNYVLLLDLSIIIFAFVGKFITSLMKEIFPGCVFYMNGIRCPTCGGTRCVENFITGDFISAFQLNQYFFFLIIYIIVGIIALNIGYVFKVNVATKISGFMFNYKAVIVWAVLMIPFGALRISGVI